MEELIERSYTAIKKRGLINDWTMGSEFIKKAAEELKEWKTEYFKDGDLDRVIEECTDLMTVCVMYIKNAGYNPIEEFEKVVIKNEKRAEEI